MDLHSVKSYGGRVAAVCLSVYVALYLSEFILWRLEPKPYRAFYGDLYTVADGRAVPKPGYDGRFDLDGATIETRVNSYGYRGHEPSSNPKRRVLLLGDSFAFGALLDQTQTIDARMEEEEPGLEVDNLGVIGYNLPQQLAPLRAWTLPADQVVYLFYYNDFFSPVQVTMTADGNVVGKQHPDGTLLSEEEIRAQVARRARRGMAGAPFDPWLSMRVFRVRQLVGQVYRRWNGRNPSIPSNEWPNEEDPATIVPRSLAYTLEMRDLAVGRQMKFEVAIAPAVDEVRAAQHFPQVTEFIAGLRDAGIIVVDLLPRLSTDDYWSADPHFNPKGARIAADEILKSLKEK